MKAFSVLLISALVVLGSAQTDDRVVVNIYSESLCPDCMDFFETSFKQAVNTADFELICKYDVFPYGNAHQTKVGSEWQFTCQHGAEECYGNLLEVCAFYYLDDSIKYKWLVCLEEQISVSYNFNTAAQTCYMTYGVSTATATSISDCVKGTQGNDLQH
jgi:interferon, gamma-inducible protein 30